MSKYVHLRWKDVHAKGKGHRPVSHMPMILGQIGIGHDMPDDVSLEDECPCRTCDKMPLSGMPVYKDDIPERASDDPMSADGGSDA